MYRKWLDSTKLLNGATSTTSSVAYPMSDYEQSFLTLVGDSANCTVKVQISFQDEAPDFSSAASVSNQWSYVCIRNLDDGTNIDGNEGVALTASGIKSFLVNTPGARWLGVSVTSYTSGSVTAYLNGFIS